METYKRVFVIVLDSLGIGAMPDSEKFGDKGVDTFGHILDKMGTLDIPNLQKLGMLNLHKGGTMEGVENPIGRYMRIGETSNGKDTMTGHWEMMGIYTQKPFITFTETGFPKELIDELEKRCGKRVIGNKSASGTEIIEELGEEEINTGAMIVYTSADSVMQICGNEETFDLANLYRCCEIARELTMKDEWRVGRVIARPYVGKKKGEFKRTSNRHDYALKPTGRTVLNALKDALTAHGNFWEFEQDYINYALHFSLWNLDTITGPNKERLYNKLKNEWFAEFGIDSLPAERFYDKKEYAKYLKIKSGDFNAYCEQ